MPEKPIEDVSLILLFMTAVSALCLIGGIVFLDLTLVGFALALTLFWGTWSYRHIKAIKLQNNGSSKAD